MWGDVGRLRCRKPEPGPLWEAHTPLGNQLELLDRTNVYWGETETIDGNRTTVIDAHPSKQTLVDFSKRRQRETTDIRGVTLKHATLGILVDSETDLLLTLAQSLALQERRMSTTQSELELEMAKGGATASARITIEYTGYDEPLPIEIPEAVRSPDNHAEFCPGACRPTGSGMTTLSAGLVH